MNPPPDTFVPRLPWSEPQRKALLFLVAVFWIALAIRYVRDRGELSDPPPSVGPRAAELAARIDPNTDEWQSLAAIPTLGEKRAQEIVRYREHFIARGSGPIAFRTIDDLTHVRGIGAASASNLQRYFQFPPANPSTK